MSVCLYNVQVAPALAETNPTVKDIKKRADLIEDVKAKAREAASATSSHLHVKKSKGT